MGGGADPRIYAGPHVCFLPRRLRDKQAMETQSYTNDLHEASMRENCTVFWKCWHSKFEQSKKCRPTQVDGCVDPKMVVDSFTQYFQNCTRAIIALKIIIF